ncbi:MAG: lipopolysaccharide biosynthesis protein, partial [Thermotogae bacterium]
MDSERELTLADILLAFRRRMKIFWTVFILTVVATGIYLFFIAEPTYEASARVKVQGGGAPRLGLSVESILSGSLFSSSAGLQDEIEILKSRTNIMSVIEKLDLVHKLIDEKDLETALNEGRTMDDMKVSLYSTIVNELVISPVKNSNIIEVKFSCEDPKLASEVVNEIVQSYMNFSETIAKRQITLRKQFIDEQLPAVELDLKKAEEALTKFKEETNIYDADTQAKSLLDLMITMSSKLEEAKIQVDMSEKTLEFYTAQLEGLEQDLKDVRDSLTFDPIVLQLKSKLINLQVEIAGLKETYTENNPTVLEKQRELQETKSQLETEVARIMSSKIRKASNPVYQQVFQNLITGEAQRLVHETQVEAYQKLLDDLQKQLAKLPYLEQRLIGLQREYMAKQTVYQTLVQAQYE